MIKKTNPVLKYESLWDYLEPALLRPARGVIPEWYKKILPIRNNLNAKHISDLKNTKVKACTPFLEAITCGYILSLPFDIFVSKIDDKPQISWEVANDLFDSRYEPNEVPIPFGMSETQFVIRVPGSYMVPNGYSFLFTQPMNRPELPFTVWSGVIDGGHVSSTHSNIPIFIKKDFEGIIPAGTPIAQIIPFKNEKWKVQKEKGLIEEGEKNFNRSRAVLSGWYKKTFWVKKEYN